MEPTIAVQRVRGRGGAKYRPTASEIGMGGRGVYAWLWEPTTRDFPAGDYEVVIKGTLNGEAVSARSQPFRVYSEGISLNRPPSGADRYLTHSMAIAWESFGGISERVLVQLEGTRGGTIYLLYPNAPATGSETWTIGTRTSGGVVPTSDSAGPFRLVIRTVSGSASVESAPFRLLTPPLTITQPALSGGRRPTVDASRSYTIRWTSSQARGELIVDLFNRSRGVLGELGRANSRDGSMTVTMADEISARVPDGELCRIRIYPPGMAHSRTGDLPGNLPWLSET